LKQPPVVNPWLVAITVTLATFMEVLDTSVANVALPHISGSLSVGVDESTWVLTSYLVANAIVLPISGWIASVVGRKRFYMSCVVLFTTSSFLCGLAPNLGALIFFRVLQGLGGGGLQPSEQAILADTFPPAKRGMAFAFYGFAVVFAPAIGPTLGGWITDYYSWRWIFYINIPVGILSLFMTHTFVHDPPYLVEERRLHSGRTFRIDFVGLSLVAIGLGCLQVMLDRGEREDWFASSFIQGMTATAALAILLAIVWELRHPFPVVDLRLLGERNFGTAMVLMLLLGFVLLASTVLIPQLAQVLLGYTATRAGLVISPGGVVLMACMPVVGLLVSRVDARLLISFGFLSSGLALVYLSRFSLDIDFGHLALARVLQSSGLAFVFIPINTVSYSYVPRNKTNEASGLINLARNIGGSIGISVTQTLIARRAQVHQTYISAHVTPYDPLARALLRPGRSYQTSLRQVYAEVSRQASMLAFADCFRLMAIFFFVAIGLALLLRRPGKGVAAVH
jgi:DHA2 family multidrug resistance protein